MLYLWFYVLEGLCSPIEFDHLDDVKVGMLASSAIDYGFELRGVKP